MARWTPLDPTNVDLTDFDLSALRANLDPRSFDPARLEQLPGEVAQRALEFAKDATYVAVGFGLLSFQRLQVRRRELERTLHR